MAKTVRTLSAICLAGLICLSLASCDNNRNRKSPGSAAALSGNALSSMKPKSSPKTTPAPTIVPIRDLNADEEQLYLAYERAFDRNASLSDIRIDAVNYMELNVIVLTQEQNTCSEEKITQIIQGRKSSEPVIEYTVNSSESSKKDLLWTNDSKITSADYFVNKDYVYHKSEDEEKYTIVDRETEEGMQLSQIPVIDNSLLILTPKASFIGAESHDGGSGSTVIVLDISGDEAISILFGQESVISGLGVSGNDIDYLTMHEEYTVSSEGYIVNCKVSAEVEMHTKISGYSAAISLILDSNYDIVDPGAGHSVVIPDNIYYPPNFVGKEIDEELYAFYLAAQAKTAELNNVHFKIIEGETRRYDLNYAKKTVKNMIAAELFVSGRNGDELNLHLYGEQSSDDEKHGFDYYADSEFVYSYDESADNYTVLKRGETDSYLLEHCLTLDDDLKTVYPGDVFRGAELLPINSSTTRGITGIRAYPRSDVAHLLFDDDYINGIISDLTETYDAENITYVIEDISLMYNVDADGCFSEGGSSIRMTFTWDSYDLAMSLEVYYNVHANVIETGEQVKVVMPDNIADQVQD